MHGATAGGPRIEDYLADDRPERPALLRALVASELESRRSRRAAGIEEYLARFPADADAIRSPSRGRGHRIGPSTAVAGEGCIDQRQEGASDQAGVGALADGPGEFLGEHPVRAWPLFAAAILAVAGFWARGTVETVMRDRDQSRLLALHDADVKADRALDQGASGCRPDRCE